MPSLSSTYLLPAILLNPAFVLHLINTFISHWLPPPPTVSVSPHPFMENLGPLPGTKLFMDIHADEKLCWSYTAVMVFVQVLAFGHVQDNRVRRKSAKAAKIEREKARKEKLAAMEQERRERERGEQKSNGYVGGMDGMYDLLEEWDGRNMVNGNGRANGVAKSKIMENGLGHKKVGSTESESSLGDESMAETETSSESDVPLI
jgi:hypothetical protein